MGSELYNFQIVKKIADWLILSEGDVIKKMQEQLGKANVIDEDPTQKYTRKIQKHLCKLRKEKKFTDQFTVSHTNTSIFNI